jgi:cytochrome b subunit of formate dehydrogenase
MVEHRVVWAFEPTVFFGRDEGTAGTRSRSNECPHGRMACLGYVCSVPGVDNVEPLASDPEPLPSQRSRLSLLGGRYPPCGRLLDGRGCGGLTQTREPRRLGVVLHGPIVGVAHFTSEYATYALLAAPGSLPAGKAAAWIYSWVWVPGLGFIVFLPLLFPNGQLSSPRWRPFAWLSVLLTGAGTIMAALSPGPGVGLSIRNPFGIESLPNLNEQLQALMFALIFVASVSLVVRLHHARGVERQQIKWIAYAGALGGGASLPTYTVLEAVDTRWLHMVGYVAALVGIVGVLTAVGIAITRYRLYEIDLIINRTLVYGSLTVTLIALYFGVIVVSQRAFVLLTGEKSTLAVVASTLLIAALFTPLRRLIQGFIDRRFYRSKYDARKALEALSAQLRDETDLEALSNDLVGMVRETMQPAHVSLWLRPETASKGQQGE